MSEKKNNKITIEINGLEIFAHHGLLPEERDLGQLFRFDLKLTLSECPACETDEIADTAEYAAIVDRVVALVTGNTYQLLEKLVSVIADDILQRNSSIESVRIRAAKTAPPLSHALDSIAISLERNRRRG